MEGRKSSSKDPDGKGRIAGVAPEMRRPLGTRYEMIFGER